MRTHQMALRIWDERIAIQIVQKCRIYVSGRLKESITFALEYWSLLGGIGRGK